MRPVKIADRNVGEGQPVFICAEIGINHNGDLDIAKQLIKVAKESGCDAVKFQKRTVRTVYSEAELAKERMSPFGTTNGDLKRGLEFGKNDYEVINDFCRELKILWFTSCWDESSVDFMENYNPPCYKIASASLTDCELLHRHRETKKPIILSTGMSTMGEIKTAVSILGKDDLILMHTNSSYPSATAELNLRVIETLRKEFDVPVGYSGHETGIFPTCLSIAFGACVIERHITLDRAMWGSDQSASVEPQGLQKITEYIRAGEVSMGDGQKRVYPSEIGVLQKLRRKNTLTEFNKK